MIGLSKPTRKFLLFYSIFFVLFVLLLLLLPDYDESTAGALTTVFYLIMLQGGLYVVSFLHGVNFQVHWKPSLPKITGYFVILFVLSALAFSFLYPPFHFLEFRRHVNPNNAQEILRLSLYLSGSFIIGSLLTFVIQQMKNKRTA